MRKINFGRLRDVVMQISVITAYAIFIIGIITNKEEILYVSLGAWVVAVISEIVGGCARVKQNITSRKRDKN